MPNYMLGNIVSCGLYDPTTDALIAAISADSIQFDIDAGMTEVYAGTSMYPKTTISKDRKPKSSISGVELNLSAYYKILGATNTAAITGTPQQIPVQENYIVNAGGTITLGNTPSIVTTTISVLGNLDDKVFTKVASAPTVGQFSITGAVLTFNATDAGKAVVIAYYVDITTGGKIAVGAASIPGFWTLKAMGKQLQAIDDPAKTMYNVAIVAKSTQMISTLSISFERQKASQAKLDFTILDPGPGYDPIDIITDAKYA